MLQISKRAASEADAQAILEASYQVQSPFGVPILLVNPDHYARKTILGVPLPDLGVKKRIHAALADVLAQCPPPPPAQAGARKVYEDHGYFSYTPENLERKIIAVLKECEIDPTQAVAFAMPNDSPRMSVTLFREAKNVANKTVQNVLEANLNKTLDYPGYDAQYNFMSLWHEHAHSVSGENEAGAEKIAALMGRYAFEDCTFMAVQADMRAVHAILHYKSKELLSSYGWPCVEVIDDALALEQPPSWEDIRKAGETSYDTPHRARLDAILTIGNTFNKKSALPFLFVDLKGMADVADECLAEDTLTTPEQITIAQRFALAARRLSIGRAAYQAPALSLSMI